MTNAARPTAAPMPKANRQVKSGFMVFVSSSQSEAPDPSAAPIQNVEFTRRSTWPRTRLGISSSTAELIAAYSPPIPAPVSARKMAKLAKFHENAVASVALRYRIRVTLKSIFRPRRSVA